MRYSVSDTAEHGDYVSGPRVIDAKVKETMATVLAEIQNGTFAKQWVAENQNGRPWFEMQRAKETRHPIEEVGVKLRAMMPFLDPVTVKPGE
jgi:ketol-acid reductoisomerase